VSAQTRLLVPSQFSTIQTAIDGTENGDSVLVADGIYIGEGNTNLIFRGKRIVVASHYILDADTTHIRNTVIDCQNATRGFYFQNGEDSLSLVIGLSIRNGHTKDTEYGGGILCSNASPTIKNCIITNCKSDAGGFGAAIACRPNASPTISHCIITQNNSNGIYCWESSPIISDCVISNHKGISSAICLVKSNAIVRDCVIAENSGHYGGGIYIDANSSPIISNCLITHNTANFGGGISSYINCSPMIINCTIADNSAADDGASGLPPAGGGIHCHNSSAILVNSILWNNTPQEAYLDDAPFNSLTISYSDIRGLQENIVRQASSLLDWKEGNISEDPRFVNSSVGEYRLLPMSPCIDSGDPKYPLDPDGTMADMGAFYFDQSAMSLPDIEVLQQSLLFDSVFVDDSKSLYLSVKNRGQRTLRILDLSSSSPYFLPSETKFMIEGGTTHDVEVTFSPSNAQVYVDTLKIMTNDPDELVTAIQLVGTGIPKPALQVIPTEWIAPSNGGTSPEILVRNIGGGGVISFSISENVDWLGLSATMGITPGSFVITAIENTTGKTRVAGITISSPNASGSPIVLTVTQPSRPILSVVPLSWTAPYVGGESPQVTVSNIGGGGAISFSVLKSAGWISLSSEAGTTPDSFRITAAPNTTGAERATSITVTSEGAVGSPKDITVTQPFVASPKLSVGISQWSAPAAGGTSPAVSVTNSGGGGAFSYTVSENAGWLSLSSNGGTTPGSFSITASENSTGVARSADVIVTADEIEGSPKIISVTQAARSILNVDPLTWYAPAAGGTSPSVFVTNIGTGGAIYYSVTKDVSWLTLSATDGSTPGSFTMTAAANTTGADRSGSVTVTAPGVSGSPKTIAVYQNVTPDISLSASSHIFAETDIGSSATWQFAVINTGASALTVTNITCDNPVFQAQPKSFSVPVFSSQYVSVSMTPVAIGNVLGTMTIHCNDPDQATVTVALSGAGVDLTPPSFGLANLPATIPINAAVPLSATVTDNAGLQFVQLFYRSGGQGAFQSLNMASSTGSVFTAQIPASAVGFGGFVYYISARDIGGHTAITDTLRPRVAFADGVLTTESSNSAYLGGFPRGQWRMLSVPAALTEKSVNAFLGDENELGSYGEPNWRLFHWEDSNGDGRMDGYAEYRPADSKSSNAFAPGEAYWLKANPAGEKIVIDAGTGQSTDLTKQTIVLQPGWNQIGSPFAFPTRFIANHADIVNQLYAANASGGYDLTQTFRPWEGYFVYLRGSVSQSLILSPWDLPAAQKAGEEEKIWELQLTASCGEKEDRINYVGVSPTASDQWDAMDLPEPPGMEAGVSLGFPHEDWGEDAGLYTTDFRAKSAEGHVWEMVLQSSGKSASLQWQLTQSVEQPIRLKLFSLYSGEVWDLSETDRLVLEGFDPNGKTRFKLVAGSETFVSERTIEFKNSLPADYSLQPAYPNPFSGSTYISFAIPRGGLVDLVIFNMLGQKIRQFQSHYTTLGQHQVVWDGHDEVGQRAAAGVYFIVMKAGSFSKAVKVVRM